MEHPKRGLAMDLLARSEPATHTQHRLALRLVPLFDKAVMVAGTVAYLCSTAGPLLRAMRRTLVTDAGYFDKRVAQK